MASLEFQNLGKQFGPQQVLHDISLSVNDGEFVVLVGPSGCGKSTLLRMIAGLESISTGELLIDGSCANALSPQQRNIAMVFQSYALFPHLSVRDNICFGPQVRGEDRAATESRLAQTSEILNLTAVLDRKPAKLSGGQRQRVAMGRSIMREPRVFLFDEPLSNLDAQLRVQMRTEIKALHQRLGSTIVYVTHDQIEAMTMADRIVVMHHGRIVQNGAPLELYDKPANRFVASFIGSPSMSFFDATATPGEHGMDVRLSTGEQLARLSNGMNTDTLKPADVVAGVRPECFRREPQGELVLQVAVVEPTGPEIHVFGHIGTVETRVIFRDRLLPAPGERIRLAVSPNDVHLFERETGQRLV